MSICPGCSRIVKPGIRYCPFCGVAQPVVSDVTNLPRWFVWIALLAVLLLVAAIGGYIIWDRLHTTEPASIALQPVATLLEPVHPPIRTATKKVVATSTSALPITAQALTNTPLSGSTPTLVLPVPTPRSISPTAPVLSTPVDVFEDSPSVQGQSIPSFSLSGDGLVRLTDDPNQDYTPRLSPDQRQLFFVRLIKSTWQVMQSDPNGRGTPRQITSGSANYYHPCPSADGSQLLVASDISGNLDLFLISSKTGEVLRQLTDVPADDYAPVWLPDYTGIVYASGQGGDDDLYLLSLDGSQPLQLTDTPSFDGYPAVSPNGRQIAFYANRDGNYEVYVMKLEGLRPRRITNNPARDADPVFSPDGEWIVFESDRSGNYEIYAVRLDGSGEQNLTHHPEGDWVPSFSPDGKWLLFQSDRDGDMELYRMPWAPGEQTSSNSTEAFSSQTHTNPKDGAELVQIPAGKFLMGSDPGIDPYFYGAEGPPHTVHLSSYWIYRTEVTNAMYQLCAEQQACPRPAYNSSNTRLEYYGNPTYADYPVVYVSWKNASAYCRWAGGRLPTEAEWEKAARGTDQRLFPWGSELPQPNQANYGTNDTEPVGSYPEGASPYGALDMAGNVIEWVFDYFQSTYYQVSPEENPLGPVSGNTRVYRGGAYHNQAEALRVVMRGSRSESWNQPDIGFRCVVGEP